MSRTTKCTKPVIEAICLALQDGLPFESACECGGISKQTGYDWLKRGESGEDPFLTFSDAVKKAQAIGEYALVRIVQNASFKSWQAAAWLLERRFPDRWGRGPAQVKLSLQDREDLARARRMRDMTDEQRIRRLDELVCLRTQLLNVAPESCALAPCSVSMSGVGLSGKYLRCGERYVRKHPAESVT